MASKALRLYNAMPLVGHAVKFPYPDRLYTPLIFNTLPVRYIPPIATGGVAAAAVVSLVNSLSPVKLIREKGTAALSPNLLAVPAEST